MECHSIQFTTISINVERGIVKILFKYRYFQDLLIDIDIDIDISLILLIDIDIDIDIFQNHHIDIDIDIDMSYRYIEQGYLLLITADPRSGNHLACRFDQCVIGSNQEIATRATSQTGEIEVKS